MPDPSMILNMPSLTSIPADYGKTVPSRGRSTSPIRPSRSTEVLRRAPSRTFVPLVLPIDIIDFPKLLHPRIAIAIKPSAPIFMGGATAEGSIELTIDGGYKTPRAARRLAPLSIDRISLALVGLERSGARQYMFRCLMTDLIDEAHPPPFEMARPDQPVSDQLWEVMPSKTTLPFRLDLPVTLGPPPFRSKKNNVSYLISVLVEAKIDGKRLYVRKSDEVTVLPVHDPEKALLNLPNPLVVTDEVHSSHRGSLETVILTAGVHRQTWISGYPMFVDVRITNRGHKAVKKVELQLERSTFVYAHAAPSDETGLSDTLRLPDRCEKEIILKASCLGWYVPGHSSDLKTCGLFVPSGLISVDAGRFFGVRFFLNVKITLSFTKHLMVQLPVTIIHPNSIDIPPNSLAQVAATIEHKYRNRPPATQDSSYNYRAGQAFLAARRQSFEHVAHHTVSQEDVDKLSHLLDKSVRPQDPQPQQQEPHRRASTSQIGSKADEPKTRYRSSRFIEGTESFRNSSPSSPQQRPSLAEISRSPPKRPPPPPLAIPKRRAHRMSLEEQSSRQRLLDAQPTAANDFIPHHRRTRSSLVEGRRYRYPRLQRSTSGLKFSSSDDDGEGEVRDPFLDGPRNGERVGGCNRGLRGNSGLGGL
ncbi:MAG: hypothetical protein Q9219_001324 [cf. Caloplaca sp. 3 TL-2023]